ncbi:SDR family NAD(P)-dependent oxidoreductase [Balneolales bacterium ANBcel1]|nr:SDR family NAD(P)-dependent oxidoreductase [Balneolales bacterium ANBcel1]
MAGKSKQYIITGASRGFGRDLALELAGRDVTLHLVARSEMKDLAKEVEEAGAEAHIWQQDLADIVELRTLMENISRHIRRETVAELMLINNAGMLEPVGPAGKYDFRTYHTNLEINFVSPMALTHAFLELFQDWDMRKRVVMISSGASQKPYFGWSHYCSTKAGVDMFVKVVGIEQEQQKLPVEIIAFNPGRISTDMQALIRETSDEDFPMVQDFVKAWEEGRIGDSRDVAARLVRLITSDYIPSGKVLSHRDI